MFFDMMYTKKGKQFGTIMQSKLSSKAPFPLLHIEYGNAMKECSA